MQAVRLAVPMIALGALGAGPFRALAQEPERYTVSGDSVAIYNLAGGLKVEAGSGSDVTVEVTRGGRDAARLRVESGPIRGRQTLRVIYPEDDIFYRESDSDGNTTLDVRDDGTFNDRSDRHSVGGRHRVRISGSGGGLDAHADLRVAIPSNKRVAVYLAVGRASAVNVAADLRLSVSAANVTAERIKGSLHIDTGSGDVKVSDVEGDVKLDTGSGNVSVTGAHGRELTLDTGSGDVTAERVVVDVLKVNTGSGQVTASGIRSPEASIETGSGDVNVELLGDVVSLFVNTGSGDVKLGVPPQLGAHVDMETGSGEIELRGMSVQTTRLERSHLVGQIGDGKGRLRIETGSGGITLQRNGQ
jgi:lia operon protein LiaG